MDEFFAVLTAEAEWLRNGIKPRGAPNWQVSPPPYSIQTKQIWPASVGMFLLNPKFRFDRLRQHFYLIEIVLKDKSPEMVLRLHEVLHKHVGAFYTLQLVYGEWGFHATFWGAENRDYAQLWDELAVSVDTARILRCDNCELMDKKGTQSFAIAKAKNAAAGRKELFDIQRDLYHLQSARADPKYPTGLDPKALVKKKILIKDDRDEDSIQATTYIAFAGADATPPEDRRNILTPEMARIVDTEPKKIPRAFYYQRSKIPLLGLPRRGNITASEAVGAIAFICKDFPSVFKLPKVVMQKHGTPGGELLLVAEDVP